MRLKLRNLVIGGIATLASAGCFGEDSRYEPLTKETISKWNVPIQDFTAGSYQTPVNLYVNDCNQDGIVDIIAYGARALWIAEGTDCTNKNYFGQEKAKRMTPEIRDYATRVMNGNRELSRLLNEENIRLQDLEVLN